MSHSLSMNNAPSPPAGTTRTAGTPRITVVLIPEAAADLARLQGRTGLSKTDLVNRAISLYEFTDTQLRAGMDLIVRNRTTGEAQLVRLL